MRRRTLLGSGLAFGASVAGAAVAAACNVASPPVAASASIGPTETATLRIAPVPCDPALWAAGDYLREEGFTDLQLLAPKISAVLRGEADVGILYSQQIIAAVDTGVPLVALAGLHTGCGELWAKPAITSIRDLKGKTIAVTATDTIADAWYGFWAAIFAYVGVDPQRDVNFVTHASPLDHFLEGRADAILALSTQVPLLRASPKNPGRLLINMLEDPPYKQYYCCQLVANRDWVRQNPSAAKRVTRAVLRSNDRVASDPAAAVRTGVERGMYAAESYETIRAVLKNSSYQWRDIDAEATLRFFALQLADGKLVKGSPQQLVAQASNFGYLAQLKRELSPAN